MRAAAAALPIVLLAAPAAAQLRTLPVEPVSERAALRGVDVYIVNEGSETLPAEGPPRIEVTVADGTRMVLERQPGPVETVAPGRFAKLRYVPIAYATRPPSDPPRAADAAPVIVQLPPTLPGPADARDDGPGRIATAAGERSGFFSRFSAHEPVYGVFGPNDAGAKLQVSFAFQPFGGDGPLSALRFSYTQAMIWRIDLPSGPFTDFTYSPEVYAERRIDDTLSFALGWRHDSNGEGPARSIDANRIFIRANRSFDLGGDWQADVSPMAWLYVGKQGIAPDLERYWGNVSLTASVSHREGLKVALTGRGNFETGRGAAELFVSYPLSIAGGGLGVYLFGQAFAGYGETLTGYNRNVRHVRIGIALTR